jgi:hypothetical protein
MSWSGLPICGLGICLRQIAVLFRAGFHSFDLEIELARENTFIKVGGFKFTESPHQGRAGPSARGR